MNATTPPADDPKPKVTLLQEQLFQAALERFKDHTEILRKLTSIDLQVFTLVMSIQVLYIGWLLERQPDSLGFRVLLLAPLGFLVAVGVRLLSKNEQRRKGAIKSLSGTLTFLRFREPGIYLDGTGDKATLDGSTKLPSSGGWYPWYSTAAVLGFFSIAALSLFAKFK